MKKTMIFGALVATGLMAAAPGANAALVDGVMLGIDMGTAECLIFATANGCQHGVTGVTVGSYFAMDFAGDGAFDQYERVAIGGVPGGSLLLGGTGQGNGEIDLDVSFADNMSRHNTTGQGVTPFVSGTGVDMQGWTLNLGPAGSAIDMNLGTGGVATVACTSGTNSCLAGETYTLDYTTVVADSEFNGIQYQLHLEGTISSVPVPAAVWLFGSGLIGLIGVARRKKV